LENQNDLLQQAVERIAKQVPKDADEIWAINDSQQRTFAEALTKLSRTDNIKNNGAILARMCEIVLEYCEANQALATAANP
jgi:hypothetical protein